MLIYGIVYPNIVSSFIHLKVVPNSFFSLFYTKDDILKNNQTIDGTHWKYYGSQWLPSTVWLPSFFKISYFCVQLKKKKKLIQVWNKRRVSKLWQNCNFWVNSLFNSSIREMLVSNLWIFCSITCVVVSFSPVRLQVNSPLDFSDITSNSFYNSFL